MHTCLVLPTFLLVLVAVEGVLTWVPDDSIPFGCIAFFRPPLAVKFLTVVVSKLQARPNRGIMLMVWLRAVLMVHTSYLMTVPDLPQILEGMYVSGLCFFGGVPSVLGL